MNTYKRIAIIIFLLFQFTFYSCSESDDINSIFFDRTWYVTGATINGKSLNGEDVKSFYTNKDSYYIHLLSNYTFTGKMDYESYISGVWNVDGTKHLINFKINNVNNVETNKISQVIFNIFLKTSSYSGDTNNIILKQDRNNCIYMSRNK